MALGVRIGVTRPADGGQLWCEWREMEDFEGGQKPSCCGQSLLELSEHRVLGICAPNLRAEEQIRNRWERSAKESFVMYTGEFLTRGGHFATGPATSSVRALPLDDSSGLQLDSDTSPRFPMHMNGPLDDDYEVRISLSSLIAQKTTILVDEAPRVIARPRQPQLGLTPPPCIPSFSQPYRALTLYLSLNY